MLLLTPAALDAIQAHGQQAYPNEGAGLLLGRADGADKRVEAMLPLTNRSEAGQQHHRYLLTPQDMLHGEDEAARRGLEVIGVFHSHPDHPAQPSEFDREWALPWYAYVITSIRQGQADQSRAWRLKDDRSAFDEEKIVFRNEGV